MSKTGPTRRLAVGIEYDGTRFAGWQQQPGLLTIQDAVQKALSNVADHPVTVTAAGRTDAGVHACGRSRTSTRGPTARCADGCSAPTATCRQTSR